MMNQKIQCDDQGKIIDETGESVGFMQSIVLGQRVAACLTACAGTSTEWLEKNAPVVLLGNPIADRFREVDRLLDELQSDLSAARNALLWTLYHHQGGSSHIGQPIRKLLGIKRFDNMTEEQIRRAKIFGAAKVPATANFPCGSMGEEVA